MRFSRRRNFRSWTRETSALAHAAKRAKRLAVDSALAQVRTATGLLRHTIRIENHLNGSSVEIKLRQAARSNQVIAETFGRTSKPHGLDYLLRHLRKRLVVTWNPENV